ncbi:hypothetical protein, partial [Frankia tisae]|uniref:hypothetical protein n=2 Tax=Frankia tisae TaxID=2950104 RepID=UPI0021C1B89F
MVRDGLASRRGAALRERLNDAFYRLREALRPRLASSLFLVLVAALVALIAIGIPGVVGRASGGNRPAPA